MPPSPLNEDSDSPRSNTGRNAASWNGGEGGDGGGGEAAGPVLPESDRMLLCTQVRGLSLSLREGVLLSMRGVSSVSLIRSICLMELGERVGERRRDAPFVINGLGGPGGEGEGVISLCGV